MHILLIDHALEIRLLGSWLTTGAPQPAVLHCPPLPNASTHARTYVRTLADHGCLKFGTPGALHTSGQLQAES